ncbi:MAG TPA: glycosyltransferase family 4 protein, partial [Cyanobacteria bacterium UBA8553]|nr:glycosyltransferase family 4 protein [Cyanobacteria bacterium UBA8553]
MRLTLVISSISSGGAERVMSIMANYWVVQEWEITLLTFDDGSKPPFYDLDFRIRHISLNIAGESPNPVIRIWNNLKRVHVLQTAIAQSKPDAVISFIDQVNVLTLLATRSLNIPVVVSERVDPTLYSIGRIWEQLRRWTYPLCDRLVVQAQGALNYFSSELPNRVCIIPNPVLLPTKRKATSDKVAVERVLIAIGRFTRQKGFDLLLQAFARLKDDYPEWTVMILGDGELRTELESMRNQLGLSERVNFPGVVKNPDKFLVEADIFVMPSRFEGFPNALCEAMACGLPVISTDCPSGPREIIRHDVDGILVPNENVEALVAAMEHLMSDEAERTRLST